ncbi:MAG TPA: hypothetical protein VG389_21700 [Myxococcota bacterium]|jgi:hypothetical protein|nr:hypothetical protein [Myxococcota bacterium]
MRPGRLASVARRGALAACLASAAGAAAAAAMAAGAGGCTCQTTEGTDAAEPLPACSDTLDNDIDGIIDFPFDPGCIDAMDEDETDPPLPPICADGLDNDGDGTIDFPLDMGCYAASDSSEDEIRQCNDDVDNDGDALSDFPFDPGCAAPGDDDETDPPPPACSNAMDDDGDALADYPNDPGCLDANDDDEDDPDPLPDCANAVDDDGDALTDFPDDPDCFAASDDSEDPVILGPCGTDVEVEELPADGDVTSAFFGGTNRFTGSCGGLGGERIFHLSLATGGNILITTDHAETALDTVVYVRTDCTDSFSELACNDETDPVNDPGNHASTVMLGFAAVGEYFIFVDTFAPTSSGPFRLTVDRLIALGDACDTTDLLQTCEAGTVCRELAPGAGTTCELPVCNDTLDNDGDALADYPADPGCLDPFDPTELDPSVAPACANALDDDADALTDWPADPGCAAASDSLEAETCGALAVPLADLDLGGSASGTDADMMTPGSGSGTCGGGGGPDLVYAFHLDAPVSSVTVDSAPETDLSTAIYLRTDCDDMASQLACDVGFFGDHPAFTTGPLAAGDYYLWVDSVFTGLAGNWAVHVTADLVLGAACDPGHLWQRCGSGTVCADDAPGPDFTCRVAACANGVDDEAAPDGAVDWPEDPGCDDPSDDDETDPPVPPVCANGADDDGDGRTDFPADPGCAAASGGDEANECGPMETPVEITTPVVTAPGMEYSFMGFTPTGPSLFAGTCGGASAPESVYMVEVGAAATSLHAFTVMTGGGAFNDTVLYVRSGNCLAGAQAACNDDTVAFYSDVTVAPVAPGFYFIFVDGYSAFQFGDYELHVELTP